MQSKVCVKCHESKPLDRFSKAKTGRDGYRTDCKDCIKEYSRKHYQANRAKRLKETAEYRKNNPDVSKKAKANLLDKKRAILDEICGTSCIYCGKEDGKIDRHHAFPWTKTQEPIDCNLDQIRAEADLCVSLCSSCHYTAHHYEMYSAIFDTALAKMAGKINPL
jgi:hypothetical protein